MTKRAYPSLVLLALLGLTLIACGSGGPGPFAGSFSGNYNSTITETSPQQGSIPSAAMTTLSITESATSDMVFDMSQSLGTGCLLNASRSGSSATINANQSCTVQIQGGSVTLTISNGVATINGNALMITLGGNVTGSVQGAALTGTFTFTFAGSKK